MLFALLVIYIGGFSKYLTPFFNFFPHVSDVCEKFKIPYVCWSVDRPVLELFRFPSTKFGMYLLSAPSHEYEALGSNDHPIKKNSLSATICLPKGPAV